ncbi:MAG: hypothetical protein EPN33_14210 [Acidobacteria bacterium]|nr:MAG: hypothetical protein EPN33_14210 [Acidobacteriota bacterium]
MKPWWERIPERLKFELDALRDAGIEFTVQEQDARRGVLTMALSLTAQEQSVEMVAEFPPTYPHTRFELFAKSLALEHHQNPFAKNLCLFANTGSWGPEDYLAECLRDRLPRVLELGISKDKSAAAGQEAEQAEPVSAYYPYAPSSIVLVDSSWNLSTCSSGTMLVGCRYLTEKTISAAVLELRDPSGQIVAVADPALRDLYNAATFSGDWSRVAAPILEFQATRFLEMVRQQMSPRPLGRPSSAPLITGIIFPEEIKQRESSGDGWLFVVEHPVRRNGFRDGKALPATYFARAGRAGNQDMLLRIPELSSLEGKAVAIIGLGCVGAPVAIELAKAGIGDLRLVEPDFIEPGTVVRWPLGVVHSGEAKGWALNAFLRENFPRTKVTVSETRVGSAVSMGGLDLATETRLLDGIDLVFDATADPGLHMLVSAMARARSLPYICAYSTHGGWGGRLVRIRPNATLGCWWCFLKNEDDGLLPTLPEAPPMTLIQPQGCNLPTFTAAAFDVQEVSLAGIRLAVSTLLENCPGGYPATNWDVGTLTLRTPKGALCAPSWTVGSLERHPECRSH